VWCHAINDTHPRRRSPPTRLLFLFERVATRLGGGLLLLVVTGIILSIALAVYWYLLPTLCGLRPFDHVSDAVLWCLFVGLTVIFEVNIFFNYFVAVFATAGSTKEWPKPSPSANHESAPSNGGDSTSSGSDVLGGMSSGMGWDSVASREPGPGGRHVSRHAFKDCRLCVPCGRAKPPKAHHCRTCGTCVQSMDHHCPFVNNCVGADNMRHFLLFLGWATSGCMYALSIAVLTAFFHYDELSGFVRVLGRSSDGYEKWSHGAGRGRRHVPPKP
jgi:palmitoyltransferase